jgi:hypothetical protein
MRVVGWSKTAIAWFTLFPMRLNCKSKEIA